MEGNNNNFLQSDIWRQFQEVVGHRTFFIESGPAHNATHNEAGRGFSASIIEHKLPVVGEYFYVPRGPIISADAERISNFEFRISNLNQNSEFKIKNFLNDLIDLVKKNNAGWIRIEPENNQALELIRKDISLPIKKAPHDMQPREILVMDISKAEEELLAGMKSKTRYNIKLAEKRGVSIKIMSNVEGQISNQARGFGILFDIGISIFRDFDV